jgi:hypothetical protein
MKPSTHFFSRRPKNPNPRGGLRGSGKIKALATFLFIPFPPRIASPSRVSPKEIAMSNSTTTPSLITVYAGREYLGFILARGREGYEAFDHNEVSRGLFTTQQEAAASLSSANDRADERAAR